MSRAEIYRLSISHKVSGRLVRIDVTVDETGRDEVIVSNGVVIGRAGWRRLSHEVNATRADGQLATFPVRPEGKVAAFVEAREWVVS